MKKIMVIDDEKSIRDLLKIALTEEGYEVTESRDGKEGLEKFSQIKPDIVLTDVNMPKISGIDVSKRIKEISEDTDVIIMTGYGTEELVIEALRNGASNYIKKPINFKELFSILDSIILKKETWKRHEISKDVVVYEEKKIFLDNDMSKVWGVVNQVLFNLPSSLESKLIEGLKLGLYEIIVNAIEHGNLGITYEQKKEALQKNTYSSLVKQRIEQANKQGKKVFIISNLEPERMVIEIQDQGKGFNINELPGAQDPEALLSANGRGILLASLYFDSIDYIEPGNRVLLQKNFKSIQGKNPGL